MDMLPACLKGHAAMLGQRQHPVLVLGTCVLSHGRVPSFPNVCGQGRQNPASLCVSQERLGPEFVLLFAVCVPCWHQQAEDRQRNIWAAHPMAEHLA